MANNEAKTNAQFEQTIGECRALFEKKLHDYGASWRILRPESLTDQLFIKAKRIRSLEIKKESLVGEGIRPEFIALKASPHTSSRYSRAARMTLSAEPKWPSDFIEYSFRFIKRFYSSTALFALYCYND